MFYAHSFSFQPPFYNADRLEMLRNIIYQPLVLKPRVSSAARDLLKRLLNRDRAKRLGAKRDLVTQQAPTHTQTFTNNLKIICLVSG